MLERKIIRGIELAFDWVGGGRELIVFIHGVGADRHGWAPQVEYFSQRGFSVAAIDMRGTGDSQAREASGKAVPISIADFALDVHQLILELGYDRAHWVGNSMGGVIIQEAFRQSLATIDRAVLCNTFAFHLESAAILPRPGNALKTKSLAEFAAERIPFAHRPDISADILKDSIRAMSSKDVETYLLSWRETWSQDYRGTLPSVGTPTLIVTGSLDKITPPALGLEIRGLIPSAQYYEIANASHLSNLDQPEEFNRVVSGFISST